MNEILQLRFDALGGYARSPRMSFFAEELRWFETEDGLLIATLIQDTDGEYSVILMARDLRERFRFVRMTDFHGTSGEALEEMGRVVEELLPKLDEERRQGDDKGTAVDFFAPLRPEKDLSEDFLRLAKEEGYSPAREIIEPMMRWHEDTDGNFVEQFQTTAFDARIWELYLFAVLTEVGYVLDRAESVPDLMAAGPLGEFCIEATTINPSRDPKGNVIPPPPTDTTEEIEAYSKQYVPIRYAGPLTRKLARHYWELPHVVGKPLAIAIMDFHAPMSMAWTRTGLSDYLYGYSHEWIREKDGSLRIIPKKIAEHIWGAKRVPSGFFELPEAENISAVLFNSSATISKFNRMGVIGGFGSPRVRLIRTGIAVDHDPNSSDATKFTQVVDPSTYMETWMEGMDVFHNQRARHPLDPDSLPGAAHHQLLDSGLVESLTPRWHPLGSLTYITLVNP